MLRRQSPEQGEEPGCAKARRLGSAKADRVARSSRQSKAFVRGAEDRQFRLDALQDDDHRIYKFKVITALRSRLKIWGTISVHRFSATLISILNLSLFLIQTCSG